MIALNDSQVADALKRLGHYRVVRAQEAALEGPSDGISGSLLIALGLRETGGRNIEGGAKWEGGKWVALDPTTESREMDVGVFQISRRFHLLDLRRMPGVKAGTWGPLVNGHTAADGGYCPQFEESVQYVIREMREAQAYAEDHGVPGDELARFGVAAHNGGWGGALNGFKAGDVDKFTTGGDYSSWVLAHRTKVNSWLNDPRHANWKVSA